MMTPEHLSNIPDELKQLRQWCCWKSETIKDAITKEARQVKIPRQVNGGARARSNDEKTWNTFEAAIKVSSRYDGIEFIVSEHDPFTVIDLDHCVDTNGKIEPWARKLINKFNSYSEYSQSKTGVHIIVKGKKPGPRCRIHSYPNFEMYDKGRPFIVTGNRIKNSPLTIEPAANELIEVYNEVFGSVESEPEPTVTQRIKTAKPSNLSDWELIEKAKTAKNGSKLAALWYGDASEYDGDMSAASLGLCNILAFWTQDDIERMDRLFRQSGLMRDKWDSKRPGGTWGAVTIMRAVNAPHEVYAPSNGNSSASARRLDKAIAEAEQNEAKAEPDYQYLDELDGDINNIVGTLADNRYNSSFEDLIPPKTFLDCYVNYASELTDAPREFHLAVALTIMATALGNRIYINVWGQHIYPNLWMIILAPTGFYRKSTAINIGLKAIKDQCSENVFPNDFTREKLIESLQTQPFGMIPVFEFGELLARLARDYNAGTKEFLTDIYDGHGYSRATKRETINIEKPAVSILAASTIDWIHDRITEGDVRGGFLSRYLFWPSIQKNGWKGISAPVDGRMMDELQDYLGKISQIEEGEVAFPAPTVEMYNEWVHSHEDEVNRRKLPPEVQGFYTRLATYALKLAIIYQVNMDDTHIPLSVTVDALGFAIQVVEYLKVKLIQIVTDDLTTTKDAHDLKRIMEIIKSDPGISKSKLLKGCHMLARRLDDLLATLLESGQVIAQVTKTARKPKQTFYLFEGKDED